MQGICGTEFSGKLGIWSIENLKTLLLTATAAGQPALAAGYVYPNEYASMPATFTLPTIVVSELVNSLNSWDRKADGLAIHKWRAEIVLFAALGPLQSYSADSAAAELKTHNWAKAFADVLWQNQSLGGKAQIIGEQAGETRRLFEYMVGHVHWDTAVYWGMRIELPVRQLHQQAMRA